MQTIDRTEFRYQPYYCEENAWWLCAEPDLGAGERHVLFVSNLIGLCPFACQRAGLPGEIVWWDYHCVVIDGHGRLWDLDTRLAVPLSIDDWLAKSFPFATRLPTHIAPRFRLIPADDYRQDFASDRSHMRDNDGTWMRPPPPWPRIGSGMKLPDYRNVSTDGPPGRLLDLAGLLGR